MKDLKQDFDLLVAFSVSFVAEDLADYEDEIDKDNMQKFKEIAQESYKFLSDKSKAPVNLNEELERFIAAYNNVKEAVEEYEALEREE